MPYTFDARETDAPGSPVTSYSAETAAEAINKLAELRNEGHDITSLKLDGAPVDESEVESASRSGKTKL